MSEAKWRDVDAYFEHELLPDDPALRAVLSRNADAGLPAIDVSPLQGQLLGLLVRMSGARRVLEIGTLGGYSSICMARSFPGDGQLISLEYEPHHAEVARANIERAGLSGVAEVRVGAALDLLPNLAGPFDFIFIDADKPNNPNYLEWAVRLSRPGSVIVCDNVVRDGEVADAGSTDPSVIGSRAAIDFLAAHPRLCPTAIQTVGAKGYDGFAMAIVE
ncbi:MAG: O-methyltransferase [Hyphomicrobiaceae bacterium]|nr:O-methyltransferase [Hyphomicrobiaceae bacterium]